MGIKLKIGDREIDPNDNDAMFNALLAQGQEMASEVPADQVHQAIAELYATMAFVGIKTDGQIRMHEALGVGAIPTVLVRQMVTALLDPIGVVDADSQPEAPQIEVVTNTGSRGNGTEDLRHE